MLNLHLVIFPDGQTLTLDADELQEALVKGEILKEGFDNAYVVHDQIKNSKWSNVDFLNEISKKLMLEHELGDIPNFETFIRIEPLNKGWSTDKKYIVETASGEKRLLRVAEITEHDRKKNEFEMMQRVVDLGIPMSEPIEFGTCDNGEKAYQLLSWVEGEDAETALPLLPEAEQYVLGIKAGQMLKKIQTLSTFPPSPEWGNACKEKHRRYIRNYENCGMTFENDDILIRYIEEHQHLLENRPMCFSHDDYHLGNLILDSNNELSVIDFQRFRKVDPYHAMNGLIFSAKTSPYFATGQVHGYFEGEPPFDFWDTLKLHMAALAVNFLPWSIPFGQKDIDFAYQQIADVLSWYSNMQNAVPSWYLKDFYIQWTDGILYKLKEAFDFHF